MLPLAAISLASALPDQREEMSINALQNCFLSSSFESEADIDVDIRRSKKDWLSVNRRLRKTQDKPPGLVLFAFYNTIFLQAKKMSDLAANWVWILVIELFIAFWRSSEQMYDLDNYTFGKGKGVEWSKTLSKAGLSSVYM